MLDGYVQLLTGTSLSGNIATGERLTGPLDRPNIGMFTARMGFPLLAAALTLAASKRISASRSEEHTSELQSLMRIPYAVFCLNNTTRRLIEHITHIWDHF